MTNRKTNRAMMVKWIGAHWALHHDRDSPIIAVAHAQDILRYLASVGQPTTGEVIMKDLRTLKRQGRILHAGYSKPDRYVMYRPIPPEKETRGSELRDAELSPLPSKSCAGVPGVLFDNSLTRHGVGMGKGGEA